MAKISRDLVDASLGYGSCRPSLIRKDDPRSEDDQDGRSLRSTHTSLRSVLVMVLVSFPPLEPP
eukprot:9476775-Pyramimonas_sp.AAC.1